MARTARSLTCFTTAALLLVPLAPAVAAPAPAAPKARSHVIVQLSAPAALAGAHGLTSRSAATRAAAVRGARGRASTVAAQHARLRQSLRAAAIPATVTADLTQAVNAMAITVPSADVGRLRSMPGVAAVYPDQPMHASVDPDVSITNAPQVWQTNDPSGRPDQGAGEIVAVVDTGIDYNDPDLGAGFGPGHKVVAGYDFVNNDADPMDDNGHGTHVAGIIAGDPAGFGGRTGEAPKAELTAYKVLAASGSSPESTVLEGFDAAVSADNPYRANVVNMSLSGPAEPNDPLETVTATFNVTAPAPSTLFETSELNGAADYTWAGQSTVSVPASTDATVAKPVQAPYRTYSSATDAPAAFAQDGDQFGIVSGGTDVWTNADNYGSIYLPQSVSTSSTIDTQVSAQQGLTGYGKAGIMVRNDITGSGTSPEGVTLLASPSSGIQLQWNSDGDNFIDSVTPANGVIPFSLPIHLKLERTSADSYTGYYSYDGSGWYTVGTATVPGQASTQDAGMFVTSHATGSTAQVTFDGFTVADGATPPPPGPTSYEAEAPANTIAGGARISSCSACSGGKKVGYVGNGGTLTFNDVTAPSDGTYNVTIAYLDGQGRQAYVSVDAGPGQLLQFTSTGDFNTLGTMTIPLQLKAGNNTIEFDNPTAYAPDFDRILVAATPN